MSLTAISGLYLPHVPQLGAIAFQSSAIDASAEKIAWIGRVWNKDRVSKNITKIGFATGAITPNSSTMRISLQDVDVTTGAPGRPDGTQDQTVDFADTAPTANSWYQTAALSATRNVAYGELLAIVLEYQSFGTGTIFNVRNPNAVANSFSIGSYVIQNTGTWAKVQVFSNIILEFDDGTFGTLHGAMPCRTLTSTTFGTGSTPNEIALRFRVPFPCKVDGCWVCVTQTAARDSEFGLYQGTTALITKAIDADSLGHTTFGFLLAPFTEQTLAADTTYYLSYKPTTANTISYHYFDVSDANHFQAHAGGIEFHWAERSGGAWTETTTKRPLIGISISAVDNGVGAGGAHFSAFMG